MGKVIVGALVVDGSKVLLVQETKEKCRGLWNLPAGHLENEESAFDGALREVLEESGYEVNLNGVLLIANKVLRNKTWVGITFLAKDPNKIADFDKAEIAETKWFEMEEVLNMQNCLRDPDWVISAINNYKQNKIADLDFVKVVKNREDSILT